MLVSKELHLSEECLLVIFLKEIRPQVYGWAKMFESVVVTEVRK